MKRTTASLVEGGYVARADDPTDGRQVILSLTPEGQKALRPHPPAPRRVDDLAARAPHRRRARPAAPGCARCWPRWPANEPHLPVARDPQLPHLRLRRDRLQRRHVDGAGRPGLARAHRAHRPLGHGTRHRHGPAVPALPRARPVRRHARRPAAQAAAALRDADGPARHRPAAGRPHRDGSRRAVARLCPRPHPGGRDRRRQPGPADLRLRDGRHRPPAQRRRPQQRVVQPRPADRPCRRRPRHRGLRHRARRSSSTPRPSSSCCSPSCACARPSSRRRPGPAARARSATGCATCAVGPTSSSCSSSSSCSARSA